MPSKSQGDGDNGRKNKAPGHAEQGGNYIFEQQTMTQQISNATSHTPWAGQDVNWVAAHGNLPGSQQKSNKNNWSEPDE
jgi:hypothetical protein